MNTLPSTSFSQQIVFDGTADGLSFDEFVQRFEKARQEGSNLANLSSSNEIEDVIPSHLYGDALRYYETLDPDCQRDWSQLRSVMTRKFPGAFQKETMIPRSTTQRDSLRTVVQAPPITSSMLAGPERAIAIPEEEHSGSAEGEGDKRVRASVSRFLLTEKFRALLSSPTPSETDPNSAQHITAHSMFIQFAWWDPPSNVIQVKVDLSNRESVAACKEGPLFTIPSSLNAARYQVGFTFTVHRGKQNIGIHHQVLAPKKSKNGYFRWAGLYMLSPTCQSSAAYPITDFISPPSPNSTRKPPLPGRYTIKSCIRSTEPGTYPGVVEDVGEITWILQVV